MSSFSPELTFFPRRHPHEITDRKVGEALVKEINDWLLRLGVKTGVMMVAKLDPHHNVHESNETWIVEVIPWTHFELHWLNKTDPSHRLFMRTIGQIFATLRSRFDLVPSLITRRKGVDYHESGGGSHVHYNAATYNFSTHWYQLMERFHRNIAVDYANRPYARWLLSHWVAGGHHHAIEADHLTGEPVTEDQIFDRMLHGTHAIEPRFMASGKNSYLTWEFRIVGMVENARQLRAAVLLIDAWVASIAQGPKRVFDLTAAKWESYTKLRGAKVACRAWVEELGLKWADYERDFFDRNYRLRIQTQKFD